MFEYLIIHSHFENGRMRHNTFKLRSTKKYDETKHRTIKYTNLKLN